jgi:hypothetical protein
MELMLSPLSWPPSGDGGFDLDGHVAILARNLVLNLNHQPIHRTISTLAVDTVHRAMISAAGEVEIANSAQPVDDRFAVDNH